MNTSDHNLFDLLWTKMFTLNFLSFSHLIGIATIRSDCVGLGLITVRSTVTRLELAAQSPSLLPIVVAVTTQSLSNHQVCIIHNKQTNIQTNKQTNKNKNKKKNERTTDERTNE